ncbi:Csa1 family protein, partial [Staphylococcus aureus]
MGNIKSFALYISILLLIVVVAGCGKSDKTKEDS